MPEGRLLRFSRLEKLNLVRLVQSGAQCTMTSTPSPTRPAKVRLTIAVDPEVHEAYQRLAKITNQSISKAMGGWLEDTIEPLNYMAEKLQQARSAPAMVIRELHAYSLGLADETNALLEKVREEGKAARASSAAPPSRLPPSGNTGGKGTGRTGKPGGKA